MRLKHLDMRPTGSPVRLHFDGREIEALEGETIAAALAASGIVAVRHARSGAPLTQSTLRAGARIVNEATVWAAFSPNEVAAIVAGRSRLYRPRRLVLATGAYEQSPAVPGWTLPGAMTVGGLQTLARSYR